MTQLKNTSVRLERLEVQSKARERLRLLGEMAKKGGVQEEWKSIPGVRGYLKVSSLGRVSSFGGRFDFGEPYILKQNLTSHGYFRVGYYDMKSKRKGHIIVHRAVAKAFLPNPYNKKTVNHKDMDRLNNNISNLEWATHKENIQHAWKMKPWRIGFKIGEAHQNAKLNDDKVRRIRFLRGKMSIRKMANLFGVCRATIQHIYKGQTWIHVK